MSEEEKQKYCELLINQIVSMFNVSKEDAVRAVNDSAIQIIIDEYPSYVDHVPISAWAEDIYNEMFCRVTKYEECDEDMKRVIDSLNAIGNVSYY